MARKYRELFSIKCGRLHYVGGPVPRQIVEESKSVLEAHLAKKLSPRAIYERAIYSVSTAFNGLEKGRDFMDTFRNDSLEDLMNPVHVKRRAEESRLLYKDERFSGIICELNSWAEPVMLAKQFLEHPYAVRENLVEKVKGVGNKVASMFYLCLGGTALVVLDRHNLRQAKGLHQKLNEMIPDKYAVGRLRKSGSTKGRRIPESPSNDDYLRIERAILDVVAQNGLCDEIPEFLDEKGGVNGAFITALFWWEALKMRKIKGPPEQYKLFPLLEFPSPFTE